MEFGSEKQQLLIEYLISSPDTFALCRGITAPEYFNPEFKKVVDFIQDYYDKYNTTPPVEIVKVETGIELKTQNITRDQVRYCSEEIEKFCRRKAMESAIRKSIPLLEDSDYGKVESLIKDALSVSLTKDLGIDYFGDIDGRMERMKKLPPRVSVGWSNADELMSGGIAKEEILMFSANSGGGKSIALTNVAVSFALRKYNVLYITLELSEELVSQRIDTMLTGVSSVAWHHNTEDITDTLQLIAPEVGNLVVKKLPVGTSANHIRAYLKEYELKYGHVPDVLIVDYLDIMGPNEKVSADNVSEKDKRTTEQLREILHDYNMYGFTASQQNRGAVEAATLNHSTIAGGLTKINTVDWYISIKMTPEMKIAGECVFLFLKTRSSDGVGKMAYMTWDNKRLLIKSRAQPEVVDPIASRIKNNIPSNQSSALLNLLEHND